MRSRQTTCDKVLWALVASDGRLDRASLRRRTKLKLSELKDILNSLTREGRIRQYREDPPILSIRHNKEQVPGAANKRKRLTKRKIPSEVIS
jgi:hypothetical protein